MTSARPGAPAPPRRFYKAVATQPAAEGFEVRLDGRPVRSPAGRTLSLPTRALADLIAAEWAEQAEIIDYASMGATRLAHTAVDGVGLHRAETEATLARYAAHDLVCYFATDPASLVARQKEVWSPLLAWAAETLGLTLCPTSGVIHRDQSPATLARATTIAQAADDFSLAGLVFGAALFGSATLALALRAGRLTGAEVMAAARLDEDFQETRWGVDPEAAARAAHMAADAAMLDLWFRALA